MVTEKKQMLEKYIRGKFELERKGELSSELATLIDEAIERLFNETFPQRQLKAAKTQLKIVFKRTGKVLFCDTAKETYKQAILELGLEKVKHHFPKLFISQPDKKTDCVYVAPGTYLKAGLNNKLKTRRIERISALLRIPLIISEI